MAEERGLGRLLETAREQEKSFDWDAAAATYTELLDAVPGVDPAKTAQTEEAKAYALYRRAFQADTYEDFKERVADAIKQYETAKAAFGKLPDEEALPWSHRCASMVALLEYWRATSVARKKELVNVSWDEAKKAMDGFEKAGNGLQLGRTFNKSVFSLSIVFAYLGEGKARGSLFEDGLHYAERSVDALEKAGSAEDLASACLEAGSFVTTLANYYWEPSRKRLAEEKATALVKKALELSGETCADVLSSEFILGDLPISFTSEDSMALCLRALGYARRSRDHLRMGAALEWAESRFAIDAHGVEDPEQRQKLADEALEYSKEAGREFSIISFTYAKACPYWSGAPYAGYYSHLAFLEADLSKKRELAIKGVGPFKEEIRFAEGIGYPDMLPGAYWDANMILTSLAKTEKDPIRKKELLSESMDYAMKCIKIWQELYPRDKFALGGGAFLAEIEFELSKLSVEVAERKTLIRQGIAHIKESSDALEADISIGGQYIIAPLYVGVYEYKIGNWLLQLFELSRDKADLSSAARSFEKAAEMNDSLGLPSRMAESLWKAAQAFDLLGEHIKASDGFLKASDQYKRAAEKLPQLKSLYRDYALYTQAWAEIERARHYHSRQEAGAAKGCYEKASQLHESTEKWKFLAPNYMAWAKVESGEELSRNGASREAIDAFKEAARLFVETKESLKTHVDRTDNQEERDNVSRLAKAADLRREYCLGRQALEEAKLLDKEGDEFASCEKFGCAADTFEKIHTGLETGQDRREIEFIMTLSKAWQTMAKAEAEASPDLYEDASKLFEQAKDLSTGEKAKLLALGHSRFCKALAAGTKFADTGDASLHSVATQNLESAAKHYLKAGLENDSEYAKASKLLFDAYVYMDKAMKEEDQAKKAKLYGMTEKVLEASAASYSRAAYPKKKDQVVKLLEKVKGERELAVTLMEVLHAPDVVSNTLSVSSPTPTHEAAVGLQRFEHADVQATLLARPKELQVGEDIAIEVELVNAGRGPAQIMKVDQLIPKGFDVKECPEKCRVEDSYLNMKGRRLDPLKTDEVSLVLKPTAHGRFLIRPRIMYLDESGAYRSSEPEPIELVVRELGISGWLKGPEKKK